MTNSAVTTPLPSNKMKNISAIGFVSFAAVLQSHLFWVYSIIYIAYNKMSVKDSKLSANPHKKKKKQHKRKRSLTSKPKTIIPSVRSNTVPLLIDNSFNIHQFIKSQRQLPPTIIPEEEEIEELKQESPSTKKDRAIDLIRSTFHKSYSTGDLKQETIQEAIIISPVKKSKREAIFQLTRKFSGRKRKNSDSNKSLPDTNSMEDLKQRPKLSLRFASWKK